MSALYDQYCVIFLISQQNLYILIQWNAAAVSASIFQIIECLIHANKQSIVENNVIRFYFFFHCVWEEQKNWPATTPQTAFHRRAMITKSKYWPTILWNRGKYWLNSSLTKGKYWPIILLTSGKYWLNIFGVRQIYFFSVVLAVNWWHRCQLIRRPDLRITFGAQDAANKSCTQR